MNPRLRPVLFVGALVLGVGGFYVFQSVQAARKQAEQRSAAIAGAEAILDAGDASTDPSRVMAKLLELGGEDREAGVLAARIELLRGRHDRAMERLRPFLDQDSDADALRAACAAWLGHAEKGAGDADARRAWIGEAVGFAERAAVASGLASDWFSCWQAASRAGDVETSVRAAESLKSADVDSIEARTVAMLTSMQQEGAATPSLETVHQLAVDWGKAPIELQLLECALLLAQNELQRAIELADAALAIAPNRFEARNFAAAAHHSAVLQSEPGPLRERHANLRDAQIQWLDANAEADDARRPQWLAWRQVR
jgi:tetratricopeptide (TPR) repeat protein